MIRAKAMVLATTLGALLVSGCASYELGPSSGLAAGAQSITIASFPNQTDEPRLSPALSSALRRQIQSDGTFTLDTRNQGDIRVVGAIIEYTRVGVSFQPDDIITIRDFEIRMSAQVTATNRRTGEVILDEVVTGRTLLRAFDDLASAERQALPLLANDLAVRITDRLVDGEW